jgi:hypothetical protein
VRQRIDRLPANCSSVWVTRARWNISCMKADLVAYGVESYLDGLCN